MARKQTMKYEAPPTKREDWIGAAKIYRDDAEPTKVRSPVDFYVFRASTDSSLFAVIDRNEPARLPACPGDGEWILFKTFAETGQPRIGLSEKRAKADIGQKGYHIAKIEIGAREFAVNQA